jgi:GntR family transcriptional regulator
MNARALPVESMFGSSPVPVYIQLAELFRQRIIRGVWTTGETLPSLAELVGEFGVARVTVRQAVNLLAQEGLLSPQPGRGTFVTANPARERTLRLETSLQALADVYRNDRPTLTLLEEADASPPLRAADGQAAACYRSMRRVHSREGEAFTVISLYLDERIFRLAPDRFRRETVIPVLLELPQVKVARARQTVAISTADIEIARLLSVPVGSPVAVVHRVFNAEDGTVIYLGEATYRGDYIHFEMDLRP